MIGLPPLLVGEAGRYSGREGVVAASPHGSVYIRSLVNGGVCLGMKSARRPSSKPAPRPLPEGEVTGSTGSDKETLPN